MQMQKYSRQQVFLHWLSAVIIIWATITGFWVALFEVKPKVKEWVAFFNVSLTSLFVPFFILRLFYLFKHGKPHAGKKTIQQRIAALVHLILYINITVVLVTGILMMDRDINIFNLLYIPQPIESNEITDLFKTVHIISCATLAGLVLLHILAVIKHELCGNRVLRRMSW